MQSRAYLDSISNPVLDRLARLVTRLLNVPVSVVTIIDETTVRVPGQCGLTGPLAERRAGPRSHALSRFVLERDSAVIVADVHQEPLLHDHPACTELGLVAFAGVPLRTSGGTIIGALCAIDHAPHAWTETDVGILEDLAAAALSEVELRRTARELEQAQDALRLHSTHDALTGLLNRRGFSERARQHLAQSQRNGAPFTIATLNLDRFRQINDQCGHDVGDEALVEMASVLTDICRDVDAVARLGGDEFTLLLSDTAGSGTSAFRKRLASGLATRNTGKDRPYALATSMGFASWTAHAPMSFATLVRVSDEALQADKRARRAT